MTALTATLSRIQKAYLADADTLAVSRDSRSGGEWADLLRRMHGTDARCNVCNLPTRITASRVPDAARLLTLIPCTLTDDNAGRDRFGYVAGNLALACKACIDASNAFGLATGSPVVFTADALVDNGARVWLTWPGLRKVAAAAGTHKEDARMARVARGLAF